MDMSDPGSIAGVSEHSQQTALLSALSQFAQVNLPECHMLKWLFAIPNGGDRDIRTAANMKAEGVKPGVADLYMPCARQGYHGFFIEMKNAVGSQSKVQKEFEQFVISEGYLYGCFHNWQDALRAILWYMNIDKNILDKQWIRALDQHPVGSRVNS